MFDHQGVDLLLADAALAAPSSNVHNVCIMRRRVQHFLGNEVVMQHHFGDAQHRCRAQRQKVRCARSGSNNVDFAFHTAASDYALFRRDEGSSSIQTSTAVTRLTTSLSTPPIMLRPSR